MTTELKKWLAIGAGGDTVRLIPVESIGGPDIFCKSLDAQAAIDAAVAEAYERCANLCVKLEHSRVNGIDGYECAAAIRAAAPTPRPGAQKEKTP